MSEIQDKYLQNVVGGLEDQTECIKPGDIVQLLPAATYYDGRLIPYYFKKEQWIVKSVNGDQVEIDINVTGTQHLESHTVNVKDLEKL